MKQRTIQKINEELISYAKQKTTGGYNRTQDLVQDVWLEVFNKEYEVKEANIPYFKGILMKKFLMALRRTGKEKVVEHCPEMSSEEMRDVINRIDMEAVLHKLNTHKDGWIVIDFYFNGIPLKEIAQKNNVKYDALKKRLSRLMQELRKVFVGK